MGQYRMGICVHNICVKMRVLGGQGSPHGSDKKLGPRETPGSLMKIRAQGPARSGSAFRISVANSTAWMALFAVVAVPVLSGAPLRTESAAGYYKQAQNAEAREDYDAAFDNYQKAYAKAPKNLEYRASLYRMRVTASAAHVTKGRKLQEEGKDQEAISEFLRAAEIDPSNESAKQAIAQMRKKNGETEPRTETSIPDTGATRKTLNRWALRPS